MINFFTQHVAFKIFLSYFLILCIHRHGFSQATMTIESTYEGNKYYSYKGTGNNENSDPYGRPNNLETNRWDTAIYKYYTYQGVTNPAEEGYSDNGIMPYHVLEPKTTVAGQLYPLLIMLHGGGESWNSEPRSCWSEMEAERPGLGFNCPLKWGGHISYDSSYVNEKYPSYVLFPQAKGLTADWGNRFERDAMSEPTRLFFELVEKMIANPAYKIDPNRVYLAGLSNGGAGAWEMLLRRPDLFAAVTPFSGVGALDKAGRAENTRIWMFAGGIDRNPSRGGALQMFDAVRRNGTNMNLSIYEQRDHWSWVDAYHSKYWMQWVYGQNKKDIVIKYGMSSVICVGADTAKLGISIGFLGYQWQKNLSGVFTDIAGATTNNYGATEAGEYRVRFLRKIGTATPEVWVESNPITITASGIKTATPFIISDNNTALEDNSDNVTLIAPPGKARYQWFRGSISAGTTQNIVVSASQLGTYTLQVTELGNCPSLLSPPVHVTLGPASGLQAPSNLVSSNPSASQVTLSWTDNSGDEAGFEIEYHNGNGQWSYGGTASANTTVFTVERLNPQTQYTFRTRAINSTGYSPYSNEAAANTLQDLIAPTAPSPLYATTITNTSVVLVWNSSKDAVGVRGYELYMNGVKLADTWDTTYTVSGLAQRTQYQFYVRSADYSSNFSPNSNTVTLTTSELLTGVDFSYYDGNWSNMPNFSVYRPSITGWMDNFSLIGTREPPINKAANNLNNFAFDFTGYIRIGENQGGQYTFFTRSDDGSMLYINNTLVVDNNGAHGSQERSGVITLTPGLHPIRVQYFEQSGNNVFIVQYQGPAGSNIAKVNIPNSVLFRMKVYSQPNSAPVANAGSDKSVILGQFTTVPLDGSGSDTDGPVTFAWKNVSGPATAVISGSATPTANISELTAPGTYVFRLTVTDNSSTIATDDVRIVVANTNALPVANAGADKAAIAGQTAGVLLTGSGSDADGPVSFSWTVVSGPVTPIVSGTTTTTATITGLTTAGTYVFRLTVSDNANATTSDEVSIVVSNPNILPLTSAGADKTAIAGQTAEVLLEGSGSDADGTVTFAWTSVSGPVTPTITAGTTATAAITGLSAAGTYVFRLTVTDNVGATAFDEVRIVVSNPNILPLASAGADKTAIAGQTAEVLLEGSGSDADGTVTFAWTSVSGPVTPTITGATTATAAVTGFNSAGTYVFRLTVTDNVGATAFDEVRIVVSNPNILPLASAGADKTAIAGQTAEVLLEGSGSDADGTVTFAWTSVSGPVTPTITGATTATAAVTGFNSAGTYVFRLTVTDNVGATTSDEVSIVVSNPNILPLASAGADKTAIAGQTAEVLLEGSGSDADGTVTFAWTSVSGPVTPTITGATTATAAVTGFNSAGTYVFRLTVTDNVGATTSDEVSIVVSNPNILPLASAGADKTAIAGQTAEVLLEGSGSDADGTVTFAWTSVSGPITPTITGATTATAAVTGFNSAGTYVFRLTVTDNVGATAFDEVSIVVSINNPPVIVLMTEKTIALPTNSTTLSATVSDPDAGNLITYSWTKTSGPETVTISGADSPTLTLNDLGAGTYIFTITATDNLGAASSQAVSVNVLIPVVTSVSGLTLVGVVANPNQPNQAQSIAPLVNGSVIDKGQLLFTSLTVKANNDGFLPNQTLKWFVDDVAYTTGAPSSESGAPFYINGNCSAATDCPLIGASDFLTNGVHTIRVVPYNGTFAGQPYTVTFTVVGNGVLRWDGEANDSQWSSAQNWTTNKVPVATDTVILNHDFVDGMYTVIAGENILPVSLIKIGGTPNTNLISLVVSASQITDGTGNDIEINRGGAISVQSPSLLINGSVVANGGDVSLANHTIRFGGNTSGSLDSIYTSGASKVVYESSVTQSVFAATYDSLVINGTGTKTVAGATTVKSILKLLSARLESNGNLIINLTQGQISPEGNGTLEGKIWAVRSVSAGTHYIGSPLEGSTFQDLATGVADLGNNLTMYNESVPDQIFNGGWGPVDLSGGLTLPLSGSKYQGGPIALNAYSLRQQQPWLITFSGTYHHPTTSVSTGLLSFTSSGLPDSDGWHLVSNPYPSYIDYRLCDRIGLNNSITIYDSERGKNIVYMPENELPEVSFNGASPFLGAMQGFWIQTNIPGAALIAPKSARLINPSLSAYTEAKKFFKVSAVNPVKSVTLSVGMDGGCKDQTVVRFSDLAKAAFDKDYDAFKIMNDPQCPSMYTIQGVSRFAVNTLPEGSVNTTVPLNFESGISGNYKITLDDFGAIDKNQFSIMLYDQLLQTSQNLMNEPSYTFAHATQTSAARFLINVKSVITSHQTAEEESRIHVVQENETPFVVFQNRPLGTAQIMVSNTLGQVLLNESIATSVGKHELNIGRHDSAVYLVQIICDGKVITKKLFLNSNR